MFDFVRVSCVVPKVCLSNPKQNAKEIIQKIHTASRDGANFIVFPELALSGYTCGDLFFQETLLNEVKTSLSEILDATKDVNCSVILGAPLKLSGELYNCAVVFFEGRVLGIVPKTFLPNYNEFSEKRWFSSAEDFTSETVSSSVILGDSETNYEIPVGNDLLFVTENGVKFAVEICEDLWMPIPPSIKTALHGAEIIFNLSASNESVGKRAYREDLVKLQSSKLSVAYAYVSAGVGESTTDLVFTGHSMIAENGKIIMENESFIDGDYVLTKDIDLGKIRADRLKLKGYKDVMRLYMREKVTTVTVPVRAESSGEFIGVKKNPFLPSNEVEKNKRFIEIFKMQVAALKTRLSVTGKKAVIGVSGGLDSTLALLVTASAVKSLGEDLANICAVTMPCFGTTDRTYQNALKLMESLGVTVRNISIKDACMQHFKDIGHDATVRDVTYENTQARERTQVLMDISNQFGGIVVGTGDLSELALGWCTYSGDQMSMYGVNAGLPKTVVRFVLESIISENLFPESAEYLKDILDTPISPELLPPDISGDIAQKTEDAVGPYELHDFFLYYVLRFGYAPEKIYFLAQKAFKGEYETEEILKWLKTFYKRFFTQQFKRSAMPDGVKVGSISLSPRGGFRMPSDAQSACWLSELENLK